MHSLVRNTRHVSLRLFAPPKYLQLSGFLATSGLAYQVLQPQRNRILLCDELARIEKPRMLTITKNQSSMQILLSMLSRFDWLLFGVAALCSIVSSFLTTLQAKRIGKLFDSLGNAGDVSKQAQQLLGLFLLQTTFSFLSSTSLSQACTNLGVNIRINFFSKLLREDMAWLDETKTGSLSHQLTQDVSELQTTIRESFTRGLESVTSLVAGTALLFQISPSLALSLSLLLPLGALTGTMLGEGLRGLNYQNRLASNRATGMATESLSNVRTVKAFACEDKEVNKYAQELYFASVIKRKMALFSGAFYAGITLGVNVTTLVIASLGSTLIAQGKITKGDVAAIATQVQLLERSLARLSVLMAQISKASKASEHIFDTLKRQPRVGTLGSIQLSDLKGNVELRNVSFSYPSRLEVQALSNISLLAGHNEVVALVGQSGSGKSTLFALLERFYDCTEGEILLDGVNVQTLDTHWLRGQVMGYVPQKPDLFSGTVEENLRYGVGEEKRHLVTHEQVVEAAKRANAHDFIMALPQGYDTPLGEAGIGLSGGQRQRLCIARTLLLDPKILLLDEITSGLDSESEFLVSQALDVLMKGRTCLVIAHRLNTVKNANRIYVFEDGQIVEQGTHDVLIQQQGAYYAYWQKQNRGLKRSSTAASSP